MTINEKFGNKIREYRESQGFNQDEFAEICQISRAYYGRIERGEHSPTLETCELISKALGVSFSDLFNNI